MYQELSEPLRIIAQGAALRENIALAPMAGHSSARITEVYDRRDDDISAGEIERIGI
jgi:hypothetical protein